MTNPNELDIIMNTVESCTSEVYDKLIETIGQNLENIDKKTLFDFFSGFVQSLKEQDKTLSREIYETQNISLVKSYAHAKQYFISVLDVSTDQLVQDAQQKAQEQTNENSLSEDINALPGNILK